MASTIALQMARPRPLWPSRERGFVGAIETLDTCGRSSAEMPRPVSATVTRAAPGSARVATRTRRGPVVVDGIGQEVGDDPAETVGVPQRLGGREVGVDLEPRSRASGRTRLDAGAGSFREIEVAAVDGFLAGVIAGNFQQRLGQAPHLLSGVKTDTDRFAVFDRAAFAGEGGLRLGNEDGDGRAEFVRGVVVNCFCWAKAASSRAKVEFSTLANRRVHCRCQRH